MDAKSARKCLDGGGKISDRSRPTDRTYCHSEIFFSYAKIFGLFGTSYQRAWSDLDITPLARQQNHNELSVLQAFGRIGKLVARTLFMMRLVFEAIFFRPAHLVRYKTHHQPALVICDVRYLGQSFQTLNAHATQFGHWSPPRLAAPDTIHEPLFSAIV